MQNKLLNGSEKDHDTKKVSWWLWLKRIKGGGSHRARARGREFFLFILLSILFFTALMWSYEPHLATLLSPQEQFGLPSPDAVKQQDGIVREPLVRAEVDEKSKPAIVTAEEMKDEAEQAKESPPMLGGSSTSIQGSSAIEGPSEAKGSFDNEGYLASKTEGSELHKESLSSHSENKDFAKPEDQPVQAPLIVNKVTKDEPESVSISNKVEDTKPLAKESFALEGSLVTEPPSVSNASTPMTGNSGIKKEDNVSKSTVEKKDRVVTEPPLASAKTGQDKPKSQLDNAENWQTVANKSIVSKESSEGSSASKSSSTTEGSSETKKEGKISSFTSEKKVCNYAKGTWVFDDRRPLYSGFKCKQFLSWAFACRLTTRPDFRFEQYRWQPENCNMPEFDKYSFLKRMQNKTIAFVGDSLGRQQFQSLMCMLTGGEESSEIQDVSHEFRITPKNAAYRFPQTNTTILYYWSSCLSDLVPYNTSDPDAGVAAHLDRPPSFLKDNLHKFDVLVLNTGHHWNRGKFRLNKWIMHINGKPIEDGYLSNIGNAKNFTIFNIAKWVDSQLSSHPRGLKAFFRTISPRHFFGGDWNTGGSCENTTPLVRGTEVNQDESSDQVVANAVKGTKVKLLDITSLSALRDEGHISKYGHKADSGVRDCLHWCLPGIPDTWNEIIAAQI